MLASLNEGMHAVRNKESFIKMEEGTNRQTKQMKTNKGQRQKEMKNGQNKQKIDKTMVDGITTFQKLSKISFKKIT